MRRIKAVLGGTVMVMTIGACSTDEEPQASAASSTTTAAPRVLPDGTQATPAQDAYLDAVEPHLSEAKASDVLGVLQSGQDGVCGVWLHPSDPSTQQQAIQLLLQTSDYNQTEATAIATAAAQHLCPEK